MGQLGLNVTFQRKSIAGRRLAGDSADRDGFPNLFVLGKNNLHTSAESKWGQRKQVTMCNTLILHVYSYRFIQIHTFVVYMCMYIYILIYIYIYIIHIALNTIVVPENQPQLASRFAKESETPPEGGPEER